ATHQPGAAAVRLLRERYLLPDVYPDGKGARADDAIRPFACTMIVQAAGLARAEGTRLKVTKAGQAALEGRGVTARSAFSHAALRKTCWESWVAGNKFDEISRIRGLRGQKAKGQRFTPPAERRAALAAALGECPAGQWVSTGDFLRLVRLSHDFKVDVSTY